ncbi:glycosyltransferase involved in cell wall biosynthesis [Salinibacter ruber]|uniref:Glycosyltransferase involved in cell wall biosynthesis n=1 Tax=Salinibacter ruber TaxID=146919 RepID=A0A9X2TZM7_9BACT|nr:glycosyltransferase family 4 protein [Salinibacter ruber]MCS3857804.1 glycosyltransferase involved in cell wall biosynthesis [Salinibacter ruber]MCS3864630.1 glycosyltransferase involved in cell wall biosynthesis [Salinibacter ruber]
MPIVLFGAPNVSHNVKMVIYNLIEVIGNREKVYVFTGEIESNKTRKYLEERCKIIEIKSEYKYFSSILWVYKCIKWLVRNDTDIRYVVNSSRDASIGASLALISSTYGLKNILRVVGDYERYKLHNGLTKFAYWVRYNGVIIFSAYLSSKVQVLGPKYYEYLARWGVPRSKLKILPQPIGVHLEKGSCRGRQMHNKYTCLFIGRLERLKGVDRLCEIIDTVLANSNKYRFVLVGEGKMKDQIVSRYKSDKVECVGSVPHEKISYFYTNADVFIFPSRTEGLPTVILEALYFGLPIASSNVGEISCYVNNTFDKINQFAKYILDEKWKKNNNEKLESMDWDNIQDDYDDLFGIT